MIYFSQFVPLGLFESYALYLLYIIYYVAVVVYIVFQLIYTGNNMNYDRLPEETRYITT